MAQITGHFYRVDYLVVLPNGSTTDPPTVVAGPSSVILNCANQAAVQALLNTASGISGSQVAKIITVSEIFPGFGFWQ